ncbi:MAG: cellulase family glycosylhydrolase [Calditrichaeota bacterium]|nr:cellulase family glycosylhydrolase [Calditrichota bacterium]
MKKIFELTLIVFLLTCTVAIAVPLNNSTTQLEIKDGWYYINGQKFFVNALGYEIGARPGQHPYQGRKSEPERVKMDMQAIKQGGFNAIRTWSELYEDELKMVQQSGLKLILGIGLKPDADFADPQIIDEYTAITKKVLSYSKNYDCIITYLIMNEPMPQHIQKVGAQATVDLWQKIIDLIHKEHPGIPVTISGNSAITEFVNMNIFDIYAYNAYDYDGFNYTHGYANAARILKKMNGQGKPLLLTEFGLSVSGEGQGRYGGNTLKEQKNMLPWYYRQILDAGAAGVCPFYYADGWWKGGEPATHNDTPEEWFGFWGYSGLNDTVGYPRPVWHELKRYNKALISSPKNQMFYKNEIPLEIFLQPDVASLRIVYHDSTVYSRAGITGNYIKDTISFTGQSLLDRELVFEFYDKDQQLLKLESIILLTADQDIKWPSIKLSTPMDNLDDSKDISIQLHIENDSVFKLSNEVRYLFSTHIGWSHGERRLWTIDPAEKNLKMSDSYTFPEETPLMGLYAGMEIRYGMFVKTIYDQKLIYKGSWADPIRMK